MTTHNRTQRHTLVGLIGALAILGLVASCRSTDEVVRTRELLIVDDANNVKMWLGNEPDSRGPGIEMYGSDGEMVTSLMVLKNVDKDGVTRDYFVLHAETGDGGLLTLGVNSDGVRMLIGPDEQDSFTLDYSKGTLEASVTPGGKGVVSGLGTPISRAQGVRLTLEHGRVVVRDLGGRDLGTLAPNEARLPPK
jgi:hypothetical protein